MEFEHNIDRAHRIGKIVTGIRRRPLAIISFAGFKKEFIIKRLRRIKLAGIYIKEDLGQGTLEKRDEQRPQLEDAKRKGKVAYFVLDIVIVKDGPSNST